MSEIEKPWTPGPWHPGHLGDTSSNCECTGVCSETCLGGVASVHVHNGIDLVSEGSNDAPPYTEAVANMRLIAAAPELVEALESLIEQCPCSLRERDSGHKIDCRVPEAKTLLAKIYGEES